MKGSVKRGVKRAFKIDVVAESDLDDAAVTNLLGAFVQDLTKRCRGRIIAAAGEISPDEAELLWQRASLGEKAAPDARLWTPVRPKSDA